MLPCQKTCPSYQEGCHKGCARWKLFQEEQRAQHQKKKQYLQHYCTQCAELTRQYLMLQARYPAR